MKIDITWTDCGVFTAFMPETPSGRVAWELLADKSGGTGKFLSWQSPAIIHQLRAAGYTVAMSRPSKVCDSQILAALKSSPLSNSRHANLQN